MAEQHHKPGSMDISAQEQTFAGFLKFVTWAAGLILVFLLFLAMINA